MCKEWCSMNVQLLCNPPILKFFPSSCFLLLFCLFATIILGLMQACSNIKWMLEIIPHLCCSLSHSEYTSYAINFTQPSFLYHVHCFSLSISQQKFHFPLLRGQFFKTKLKHKHQRIDFTFRRLVWILENDRKKIVLKSN